MLSPVQVPNSTLMAQLTELIAATNLYVGGILHLFKTPVAFSPPMDLTAFTEADFSGYAPSSTVVFTAPFVAPGGVPTITGGLKQFLMSSTPSVTNTVYGWYLTNASETVLLFWRAFDAPVVMATPLQGIDVIPAIPAYVGN